MPRPEATEYAPFYASYLAQVPEHDILPVLRTSTAETFAFLGGITEAESMRRHAPYTWSVKEVVGHLCDAERVFGYRALRFSRGDTTRLPGFDENGFAQAAAFDRLPFADLLGVWEALRRSHLYLFGGLPAEAWSRVGVANDSEVSVLALAYILVGHERHHVGILRRRLASG